MMSASGVGADLGAGVFTRLVAGDRTIDDAEQLARYTQAVVRAVALEPMHNERVT